MFDELAQHIIKELQDDARQSFREIGRKLDVSEGTVRNRVKSLIKSNSMRISAIPNPQQLGLNFMCVMCIEVKVGTAELVEEHLIKSPNVYYLGGCTGTYDIIGLFVFHTPAEFDAFVKNVIANIPEIVRTSTFVVMHVSRSPWEHNLDIGALSPTE
ncbi:MAG: Lrp/AsnC family transcriptional regulator [Dehalococcoidales bacterium]|nr:Lrp/AsnC family transcriptional regulator [Dehalococcoidales bacterium]